MVYDAAVITVSDESFWGRRADEAGPAVVEILEQAGYRVTHTTLLQKEQAQMERELMHAADIAQAGDYIRSLPDGLM